MKLNQIIIKNDGIKQQILIQTKRGTLSIISGIGCYCDSGSYEIALLDENGKFINNPYTSSNYDNVRGYILPDELTRIIEKLNKPIKSVKCPDCGKKSTNPLTCTHCGEGLSVK